MCSSMNKKENPHKPGGSLMDKIRSSLVLKLNLRMLGMLLSSFLLINIMVSLLLFGAILWKAETGARNIIEAYKKRGTLIEERYLAAGGYEVKIIEKPAKGFLLPGLLQEKLPLDAPDAKRYIQIPGFGSHITLMQCIEQATYHMTLTVDGIPFQITYALGADLRLYLFIMLTVLGGEVLLFLSRIGRNTKAIRKTLKPLAEMAETARSLHQNMAAMAPSGAGIKHLAGAISTIDAKQLHRQISVDSSQYELRDLANAINDMLNRIRRSYQSQVRFVSDASHELRTPISVIQGYAALLDRWGKHDEKTMQECINAIKSETENMKVLVEQLLFLARGDNETIKLHKIIFDCCEIVDEIIRETRLIDPAHIFETQLDGPAYIEADQQLIKQAVRILVDNSIKYTPSGEKITLKVIKEKDTVKMQVQDNGIGIAPEDIPHIFDRFYRSDESRARKTGGSGLGLSIAKWIIEHHEGHFEVLSRLNIGTRTTVILPAAKIC